VENLKKNQTIVCELLPLQINISNMETIQVRDKSFKISITAKQIDEAVIKIANQMNTDLKGKNPLFLVVLNGAFMFASDLMKKIIIPCEISFVKLSSYVGTQTTSTVRELIGLDEVLHDRTVVIVEDIIDTGITMGVTMAKLKNLEAEDVKIATLLFKPEAFQRDYPIDYIGLEISNDFIVGYGLDYDGNGRNIPEIYKIVD
jgi:hypoxanthine phosphoribosyltransferase